MFIKIEQQRLDHELRNNQNILDDLAGKQETLAKMAIEKWYEEELRKSKSQDTTENNQNGQHNQFKFEDTFWKLVNSPSDIQYFFRNGSPTSNELLYREDGKLTLGKWNYGADKSEIAVDIFEEKRNYKIDSLSNNSLKLKEKGTTEIIEFEKTS